MSNVCSWHAPDLCSAWTTPLDRVKMHIALLVQSLHIILCIRAVWSNHNCFRLDEFTAPRRPHPMKNQYCWNLLSFCWCLRPNSTRLCVLNHLCAFVRRSLPRQVAPVDVPTANRYWGRRAADPRGSSSHARILVDSGFWVVGGGVRGTTPPALRTVPAGDYPGSPLCICPAGRHPCVARSWCITRRCTRSHGAATPGYRTPLAGNSGTGTRRSIETSGTHSSPGAGTHRASCSRRRRWRGAWRRRSLDPQRTLWTDAAAQQSRTAASSTGTSASARMWTLDGIFLGSPSDFLCYRYFQWSLRICASGTHRMRVGCSHLSSEGCL